jgi:hypothetical protein
VIDLESAPQRPGRRAEGLGCAQVAREPGEGASADLHPDPVPGPYPVGRRVELHVHRQDLVVAGLDVRSRHGLRAEPPDAVDDVAGDAFAVNIANPDEKVGMRRLVRTKMRALTGPARSWSAASGSVLKVRTSGRDSIAALSTCLPGGCRRGPPADGVGSAGS